MNITKEEKLMYEVMKAIYDSGIPISFKGSMVLKACLVEAGYYEDTRRTVDIDANWNSEDYPSPKQMVESLQNAIDRNGIDLSVSIYRMYGEGRSAGFELRDRTTGEIIFTMDVDVNRPEPPTKEYTIEGMRFVGVAPIQMISDKVSAISSNKVFSRVKDIVDLNYFSKAFTFDRSAVLETLKNSQKTLGDFDGFLHRQDELRHAYDKFRFSGDVNKPSLEEIYNAVKSFISPMLPGGLTEPTDLVRPKTRYNEGSER